MIDYSALPEVIHDAVRFAVKYHRGQRHANGPYVECHTIPVYEIIRSLTDDVVAWKIGILHDTIEDTEATYDDLVQNFGADVANGVWAVTDAPGENRKWRKAHTYWKIREDDRAMLVKLADRLHNVTAAGERYAKMYAEEHPGFVGALWTPYTKYQFLWDAIHDKLFGKRLTESFIERTEQPLLEAAA